MNRIQSKPSAVRPAARPLFPRRRSDDMSSPRPRRAPHPFNSLHVQLPSLQLGGVSGSRLGPIDPPPSSSAASKVLLSSSSTTTLMPVGDRPTRSLSWNDLRSASHADLLVTGESSLQVTQRESEQEDGEGAAVRNSALTSSTSPQCQDDLSNSQHIEGAIIMAINPGGDSYSPLVMQPSPPQRHLKPIQLRRSHMEALLPNMPPRSLSRSPMIVEQDQYRLSNHMTSGQSTAQHLPLGRTSPAIVDEIALRLSEAGSDSQRKYSTLISGPLKAKESEPGARSPTKDGRANEPSSPIQFISHPSGGDRLSSVISPSTLSPPSSKQPQYSPESPPEGEGSPEVSPFRRVFGNADTSIAHSKTIPRLIIRPQAEYIERVRKPCEGCAVKRYGGGYCIIGLGDGCGGCRMCHRPIDVDAETQENVNLARLEIEEKEILAYKPPVKMKPGRVVDLEHPLISQKANKMATSPSPTSPSPTKKLTKPRANTKPTHSTGDGTWRPQSPRILDKLPPRPASSLGAVSSSTASNLLINPRKPLPPIARSSITLLTEDRTANPSQKGLAQDSLVELPGEQERDHAASNADLISSEVAIDASNRPESPESKLTTTADALASTESQASSPLAHGTYSIAQQAANAGKTSPRSKVDDASHQVMDSSSSSSLAFALFVSCSLCVLANDSELTRRCLFRPRKQLLMIPFESLEKKLCQVSSHTDDVVFRPLISSYCRAYTMDEIRCGSGNHA